MPKFGGKCVVYFFLSWFIFCLFVFFFCLFVRVLKAGKHIIKLTKYTHERGGGKSTSV